MNTTDTAHHAWEQRWQTSEGRAAWLAPNADVMACLETVKAHGGTRALDLGCGVGRHALAMARAGLETYALDGSDAGIAHLKAEASRNGFVIDAQNGLMTALPYADGQFDYVLSFNVIYHGDETVVRQAIAEIHRVLKPNGFYQGTMLSKRNNRFGRGREIAPDTFVIEDDGDKDHPHFYCNAAELMRLFADFEPLSLVDQEQGEPGSWHWHLIAERCTSAGL